MGPFGRFTLVAGAAALSACTSVQTVNDRRSEEIATFVAAGQEVSVPEGRRVQSNLDSMRAALPGFDVERGVFDAVGTAQISVVQDISFAADSAILSDAEVLRLAPLQAYLLKNPKVVVLIQGYDDGGIGSVRDNELSRMRAQTVARALSASILVDNKIIAVSGPPSQARQQGAEIKLSGPGGS